MPFRWGYGPTNGPDAWHIDFPVAKKGHRQSPIDIQTDVEETDEGLKENPLTWKYCPEKVLHIENTGFSWTVSVSGAESCLTGGPLKDEYELLQFHAHWGSSDDHGSEHRVDGRSFAAELHLVHWNRSKYKSPSEAISQEDGLAVLGIFIEVDGEDNEEFGKMCKLFDKIRFQYQKASFFEPVDVEKFLPDKEHREFWTYDGSLTTPPLLESVTWIVFKKPMKISEDQMHAMRSLMFCTEEIHESEGGDKMVDNFRPPVPRGDRKIRKCC